MININQMEMPTPCVRCGLWFDLNDGRRSLKWYPNTIFCVSCRALESQEIERDEDIQHYQEQLSTAQYDVNIAKVQLRTLGVEIEDDIPPVLVPFIAWIKTDKEALQAMTGKPADPAGPALNIRRLELAFQRIIKKIIDIGHENYDKWNLHQ